MGLIIRRSLVRVQPPPPGLEVPRLRSGFRHAAQTPRKRLKFESNRRHHFPTRINTSVTKDTLKIVLKLCDLPSQTLGRYEMEAPLITIFVRHSLGIRKWVGNGQTETAIQR